MASSFDPTDPEKAPLTITVDGRARILVTGNVVSVADLKNVFADLVGRSGTDAAIRVRCEGNVQYRYVEPILRAAAMAGVTDAAIAVREETAR